MSDGIRHRIQTFLWLLLGGVVLLALGLYNGFPILYPDTGTYVLSGFTGDIPVDRPIFYGLLMRHVSLATEPWLVVALQSLLVSWLIWVSLRPWVPRQRLAQWFLLILFVLVTSTGVSFFANLLLPDIFTSILFLSAFALAQWGTLHVVERILGVATYVVSAAVHGSHLPVLVVTLVVVGLWTFWQHRRGVEVPFQKWGIVTLLVATLAIGLFVPTYNSVRVGRFGISSGGSVFMVNRLRDLKILQEFLHEDCPAGGWRLCAYKDSLGGDFLWDGAHSALYKTGGWHANIDEYNRLTSKVFAEPRYVARFVKGSIVDGLRQLFVFDAGPTGPLPQENAAYRNMIHFYHYIRQPIDESMQMRGRLELEGLNGRQYLLVMVAWLLMAYLAFDRKRWLKLPAGLRAMGFSLLVYFVANAWVCAAVSTVDQRYHGRVVWMLVLWMLILVVHTSESIGLPARIVSRLKGKD